MWKTVKLVRTSKWNAFGYFFCDRLQQWYLSGVVTFKYFFLAPLVENVTMAFKVVLKYDWLILLLIESRNNFFLKLVWFGFEQCNEVSTQGGIYSVNKMIVDCFWQYKYRRIGRHQESSDMTRFSGLSNVLGGEVAEGEVFGERDEYTRSRGRWNNVVIIEIECLSSKIRYMPMVYTTNCIISVEMICISWSI